MRCGGWRHIKLKTICNPGSRPALSFARGNGFGTLVSFAGRLFFTHKQGSETMTRITCLSLKRRNGESIVVDGPATIHVIKTTTRYVQVQIEAPDTTTRIVRLELLDKKGETDVL
jgi:sRNA-binding carbon storage regulator CsrA